MDVAIQIEMVQEIANQWTSLSLTHLQVRILPLIYYIENRIIYHTKSVKWHCHFVYVFGKVANGSLGMTNVTLFNVISLTEIDLVKDEFL